MGTHSEGMAGAGQPWYMPAIWPVGNITATLLKPPGDKPVQPKAKPFIIFDPFDMVLACVAGFLIFTRFTVACTHGAPQPFPTWASGYIVRCIRCTIRATIQRRSAARTCTQSSQHYITRRRSFLVCGVATQSWH